VRELAEFDNGSGESFAFVCDWFGGEGGGPPGLLPIEGGDEDVV
jgi:hypothetical protein